MGGGNGLDCDVLVVGGGASGLCAAIESARAGASVILVEKNPQMGGSTWWSVGSRGQPLALTNSGEQA